LEEVFSLPYSTEPVPLYASFIKTIWEVINTMNMMKAIVGLNVTAVNRLTPTIIKDSIAIVSKAIGFGWISGCGFCGVDGNGGCAVFTCWILFGTRIIGY
jgi:hypothetical protein